MISLPLLFSFSIVTCSAFSPLTCFSDGHCFDLTTLLLSDAAVTANASQLWSDACVRFTGFQLYANMCADAISSVDSIGNQTWIPANVVLKHRHELAAVILYPQGPFMSQRGADLRRWAGANVSTDFKAAMLLTSSGFNRIARLRMKLLPTRNPDQQSRSIVFRGFSSPASPNSALGTCNATTGPFKYPPQFEYVPFDFASSTMSLQLDLGWATTSLIAIKLQLSRFAGPLAEDLEVDLLPGTRLQLLECSSFTSRAGMNVTLPLIFAAETTFGDVDADAVLLELKAEISRQDSACFPSLCNFQPQVKSAGCRPPPLREPTDFWDPLSGDLYVVNSTCVIASS
jgi:hypothetical protein